jgi:rare lipoprotein A (peptidoglycan hydrolase)
MVERRQSRSKWGGRSRWFWVGAGAISLATAAVVFTYSTLTVQADTPLARPASTLPPAGPPASLLGPTNSPIKSKTRAAVPTGIATWYGGVFNGRQTADGERYDMFAMTAASNTLPFGTLVRVTSMRTGKSVDVRINDRGDMPHNHVIDLSYGAARKLDILKNGVAHVKLEVVGRGLSHGALR